jgi:hypothetical protein
MINTENCLALERAPNTRDNLIITILNRLYIRLLVWRIVKHIRIQHHLNSQTFRLFERGAYNN